MPPYSTDEVCRLAHISYRQVDYWIRTGLLTPSIRGAAGSGSQRHFSQADLDRVRVVKALLDAGISLQRIRHHRTDLRRLALKLVKDLEQLIELVPAEAAS